jgi:ribosomal protein S1
MNELKPGDKIKVKIIKVDIEQAKIGLSAKI